MARLGAQGRTRFHMRHRPFAFDGRELHGAFAGIKGDAKFHRFALLPSRHYGGAFVCWHCFAHRSRPDLVYTDISPGAGWRLTLESHAAWEATTRRSGMFYSTLRSIPGFHKSLVHDDLMHVLFLGVARDFTASLLARQVDRQCFGALTRQNALLLAFCEFESWTRSHGYRPWLEELTQDNMKWHLREYPALPGKAADVKWMVAYLGAKAPGWFNAPGASQWDKIAAGAAWALASAVAVLDHADMWLSPDEARAAATYGLLFMQCYMGLAAQALAEGACLWKVRPKLHAFHHVLLSLESGTTRLNPRFVQNFVDEDFIGRMATIWRAPHSHTVALRTLERYVGELQANLVAAGDVAS